MEDSVDTFDKEIQTRYKLKKIMGRGAYGEVWKASDSKNGMSVAIKRCFDAFRNSTDAQRTYRENLDFDLGSVIFKNILSDLQKQFIFYQVLRGLKYIHGAHIIHRDIKPENILLNLDCKACICDFGLCRSSDVSETMESDKDFTDYVATRWYRAPELLCGSKNYDIEVDLWSCGILLAEMHLCCELFPGVSTLNQLEHIFSVLGVPSEDEAANFNTLNAKYLIDCVVIEKSRSIDKILANVNPQAADLIKKFLQVNPKNRISINDALNHPYLKAFHKPNDEPDYEGELRVDLLDEIKYSLSDYKYRLFSETDSIKVLL